MTLIDYFKDRLFPIVIILVVLVFTGLSLSLFRLNTTSIIYILSIYCIASVIILVFDYLTRIRYYQKLNQKLKNLDKKHLICELLDVPTLQENQMVYDFLRISGKSMNDEISRYRRNSEEYREYIETWVHQIKTPIASAKLLIENNPSPVTLSIAEELSHIESYVTQALFYSRSNSVEKDYLIRKTTLKDLVNPVIRNHSKIFIQEKIKLTTTHLDLPVLADSKWAYFIIGQILDNALKYVLTDNSERIPTISILGKTDQKRTLLIISDNGIGIAQNDLEGIFSKGFTGSNGRIKSINSTGIGLYLCKKLCDKMGVLITLTSDLGYGTRVTLSFAVPK